MTLLNALPVIATIFGNYVKDSRGFPLEFHNPHEVHIIDQPPPSSTPSIEEIIEMFKNATEETPIIEKDVLVDGQLLHIDAKYVEAMEEVMDLWWKMRAQIFNVKFERLEIERESGVRTAKMDAVLNKTEELIERECSIVWNILWGKKEKNYRHPLNRTTIDELQKLWKEVEERFNEYTIEGADVEIKNFRYELKFAQDDLPRRYKKLQELVVELETRTPTPDDDEEEDRLMLK